MSISVVTYSSDNTYDITDKCSAVSWSNTDPGGDEQATFTYSADWSKTLPELTQGNLMRITEGMDILFQGYISEIQRTSSDMLSIQVTCYGTGIALKRQQMREIYIDKDLNNWIGMSRQRQIIWLGLVYSPGDGQVVPDTTAGNPSINTQYSGAWTLSTKPAVEMWYDAGPCFVGFLTFSWLAGANVSVADTNFSWQAFLSVNDQNTVNTATANLRASGASGSAGMLAPAGTYRYAMLHHSYNTGPAGVDNMNFDMYWSNVAVYGDHGIPLDFSNGYGPDTSGIAGTLPRPGQGFYVSDVINNIIRRQSSVVVDYMDPAFY